MGKFQVGHEKIGGRRPGSINKATRAGALATFERMKFDPIEKLIHIARSRKTPLEFRLRALSELARYHSPRLATTMITAQVDHSVSINQRIAELAMKPEMAEIMEKLALELATTSPNVIDVPVRQISSPTREEQER